MCWHYACVVELGKPQNYTSCRRTRTRAKYKSSSRIRRFNVEKNRRAEALDCPYILQWDAPCRLKIVPSHGGYGLPFNTWFLGPTRVFNPNGISIGAAAFAGLTSVTDRQTTLLGR